jgi:M6 family metalloprotease-like protein
LLRQLKQTKGWAGTGGLLATLVVVGCADRATAPPDDPGPEVVTTVSISPAAPSALVRGTVTLTATPRNAAGNPLSGRLVTWSSGDTSVATVAAGLVTAKLAGSVAITATSEGQSGAVILTVEPAASGWLEIVSGAGQTGLTGRALADSVEVRAYAPTGAPLPGAAVNWATSFGSASPGSATTGAGGLARAQWTVATGMGSLTASSAGLTSVIAQATGRAGGTCQLSPSAATQRFSLGPTDFTLSLDATQPVRIVVLFTDFPDAPATETPASIMTGIVTPGLALLGELSFNRIDMSVTAVPAWYRMSGSISSYTWATYAGHYAYFHEAMTLADAAVDFSQYNAVFIFAPPSAAKPNSPTFNGGQTAGLAFDGRIIGNGVTFGLDARTWGPSIVAHETGHMLGLPDLYAFDPNGGDPFRGNGFRFVGSWSLMSDVFRPGHYFAWEKRKLGWLEPGEWECLEPGAGIEVVLDPIETPGGVKMVAMPTGPSTVLVAEVRRLVGLDAGLCRAGVLLYDVDARIASGFGPARIRGSRTNSGTCGPWTDATFALGAGEISTFSDATAGIEMRLLGVDAEGRYRVRLRR